ncbi:MAG: hypothetical protein QNJ92_06705 [Alphaproteobacteria bacterium]|nr:hypothetical protein [Alphaproteobacteria bacterium]
MSSFPPEGREAALVGRTPVCPEKRRLTLFSSSLLLASACALFSVDTLIEARFGAFVHYRHDYSREDSAKLIAAMKEDPRTRLDLEVGPCVTTAMRRMGSRMLVIAHDGVCVDIYGEMLWYAVGRLEVKAGLESPGEGECP